MKHKNDSIDLKAKIIIFHFSLDRTLSVDGSGGDDGGDVIVVVPINSISQSSNDEEDESLNEHRICADSYMILNMDWSVRTFEHLLISIYVCAIYCLWKSTHMNTRNAQLVCTLCLLYTSSLPPSLVIKRSAFWDWLSMPKLGETMAWVRLMCLFSQWLSNYHAAIWNGIEISNLLLAENWKVEFLYSQFVH